MVKVVEHLSFVSPILAEETPLAVKGDDAEDSVVGIEIPAPAEPKAEPQKTRT